MIDHQFYPTPPELAQQAWNKFDSHNVTALLEPSAGRGDLIEYAGRHYHHRIDCIEAMADNIAILKSKNLTVIDTDFLTFQTSKIYSHLFLNPPFNQGVKHVLKAWDILKNGELVAIINASTIENPNSVEKRFLASLIEEHGDVEFVDSAFTTPETQRKTPVRVALVHLTKQSTDHILFSIKDMGLDESAEQSDEFHEPYQSRQQITLPNSVIKNAVLSFERAACALEQLIAANATANYYSSFIKGPRHIVGNERQINSASEVETALSFNEKYDDLKENAWSFIINQSDFTSKFSSKVIKSLEVELESIKKLQFTVKNIYGLLEGLALNKSKLDEDMLLEVFDSVTAYHSSNRLIYRGWKSNDKHRSLAFRMKHTRFILPTSSMSDNSYFCYTDARWLADMDKCFALLDGKQSPEHSLEQVFTTKETYRELVEGGRVASSYFECRYYWATGTIHFFPTKKGKELIDRFNRTVGRIRNWLPDEETVSPPFWEQYDKAEKVTRVIESNPEYQRLRTWDFLNGEAKIDAFHTAACEELNIPIFDQLTDEGQSTQLALFDAA